MTSAIVGIRTVEHLTDAISASINKGLSPEEIKMLEEAVTVNHYAEHR